MNIFRIVKGGGGAGILCSLFLVSWFSRIYSFPDTEFSEIWEGDLKFPNSLGSGDEVLGLARDTLLLDFPHSFGVMKCVVCLTWMGGVFSDQKF